MTCADRKWPLASEGLGGSDAEVQFFELPLQLEKQMDSMTVWSQLGGHEVLDLVAR